MRWEESENFFSINLTQISEFAGKQDFYMVRANETVLHIFSELYMFRTYKA